MKTQFAFVPKTIFQQSCLRRNSILFRTTPNILEQILDNLEKQSSFSTLKGTFKNI